MAAETKPLEVQVVALDWKWLFIYPEYGIATVNELAIPVNHPVSMHITASSVMNSLYIPELAGQVYAMPSMETRLHGVLNKTGVSQGFSANYSGAGFSGMRFDGPQRQQRGLRQVGARHARRPEHAHPRGLPATREAQRERARAPFRRAWTTSFITTS